ncbi:hypothetical protein NQ315_010469 [Exocentrus adspersus]|uniref:Uncharacterized protein n=1 Tax=Exocentrus adspersus TaxID=1586481 RepID=A0AAV8W4Z7_9CUCU|nr:hypothetical protein NQ315_010469 [Exocentrus adspersus]
MKTLGLILGCLIYATNAQLGGLLGGGGGLGGGLSGRLGGGLSIPKSPIPIPGLDQLEKLFLQDWLDFGTKFNKNYNPLEAPLRKANFLQNIDAITKLAQQTGQGALNFGLKINEYADMLFDEFNKLFNGFRIKGHASKALPFEPPAGAAIPDSIDWREKGAVTPVKNQNQCAGCWAFSVAGALEGHIARKSGNLPEISMQHLIDCATGKYDNDGCRGGLTETGFDYVEDNGINSYTDYPYEAINTTCRSKKENSVASCHGYVRIPDGDEKALAQALASYGPISAAIHVTKNFQFYGDKIFDDPECGNLPDNLNHAILIVGYGKEADGRKFWLVKNSYGDTWGEKGYFKLARDEGNKCGIATYARYPLV